MSMFLKPEQVNACCAALRQTPGLALEKNKQGSCPSSYVKPNVRAARSVTQERSGKALG